MNCYQLLPSNIYLNQLAILKIQPGWIFSEIEIISPHH